MPLPPRVSDLTGFDLLLSVARLGSLGRAAAEHGISQPAASARIRHLEGQLSLALIDRSPRGSTLTPAGALVADWAQAVADAAAALDAGVTALRRERESRLRVAASMTVAEYLLPAWLTALRAAGSGAAVALSAVNSAEVAEAVRTGAADICFVEAPGVPDGLRAGPVGQDTLTVVVAPSHPWVRRRSGVPPAELAATALVSRESGSGTRGFLEQALRAGRPGTRAAASRAVLHHREQGRGRGRRRSRRAQLPGRRGGTFGRDTARGDHHRPEPEPHAPSRMGAGPAPGRPGPGPVRGSHPVRPPHSAPGMTRYGRT